MKKLNIYEEASRCLLCQDAPCTKACKTGDPARAIRAIRFDNHKPALRWVKDCSDADLEAAEQACIHYNWPIRIKEMIRSIHDDDVDDSNYPSLAVDFCGIHCENPFFLASSAVCTNYEMVANAFEAGWGGVFYKTICLQENQGIGAVEAALQDILDLYELDFAKYAEPREIPRIHAIWHSLPAQLSKENRKFIYKVIKTGARSKDYEDALMWLEDAGMIHRIFSISKPGMPISAYEETDAFKVYACDCGLLRRLAHLPATVVTDPIANYTEFKGAMAENAVLQSVIPLLDSQKPYYWTSSGTAEVEFVIQWGDEIIPIEVKAEDNISGNSLSVYTKNYAPRYRMRFSMLNLQYNCGLLSSPAPLAGWLDKWMLMKKSDQPNG